jgi:hypothetical protein
MTILFLHGWQSTPGGIKPTYLKDHGHEVLNPALPDDDFDAAVRIAQAEFDRGKPDVVVGSSRGGAVAMNINAGSTPLVLLCPDWKHWGNANTVKPGTVILHSMADYVVSFADSEELIHNSDGPASAVIVVGHGHRMNDPDSLAKLLKAVERLIPPVPQAIVPEYGVPRQFGLGTMLLIPTMYAILFAILHASRASPSDYIFVGLFFFAIGLGQMFLFKGRRPRRASVIVGPFITVPLWIIGNPANTYTLFNVFFGTIMGLIYGYVAGVLIAGVFLLAEKIQHRFSKSDKSRYLLH